MTNSEIYNKIFIDSRKEIRVRCEKPNPFFTPITTHCSGLIPTNGKMYTRKIKSDEV